MKLYNRTRAPDAVVRAVLAKAGRAVGARTSSVVVTVTQGRTPRSSGTALHCDAARPNLRRRANRCVGLRWVETDGGRVKIVLPAPARSGAYLRYPAGVLAGFNDPMELALSFWRVARHEWGHIRDYQHMDDTGDRLDWSRRRGYRRQNHDDRPEELRADGYCDDADDDGRDSEWAADEILALAIALEDMAD